MDNHCILDKLKFAFCLVVVATVLLTGCTSNNRTTSITKKEEMPDSTAQELVSTPSENTDTLQLSIFDELANDMVCVEEDAGNFYICKYEVTQKLWVAVMGDNPSGYA